jgi:hypothetical protein
VKPTQIKLFVDLAYNLITGSEVVNAARAKNGQHDRRGAGLGSGTPTAPATWR